MCQRTHASIYSQLNLSIDQADDDEALATRTYFDRQGRRFSAGMHFVDLGVHRHTLPLTGRGYTFSGRVDWGEWAEVHTLGGQRPHSQHIQVVIIYICTQPKN